MAVESPHLQGAAGQWGHRQNHDGDGYPEAHLHSENIGSKEKAQPAASRKETDGGQRVPGLLRAARSTFFSCKITKAV